MGRWFLNHTLREQLFSELWYNPLTDCAGDGRYPGIFRLPPYLFQFNLRTVAFLDQAMEH